MMDQALHGLSPRQVTSVLPDPRDLLVQPVRHLLLQDLLDHKDLQDLLGLEDKQDLLVSLLLAPSDQQDRKDLQDQ